MNSPKMLVFIPTYNERENVEKICTGINDLNLGCDILFIDDNSPDGTGQVLDELAKKYPHVTVKHRQGKQGIGSAHQAGIAHAYQHNYDFLLTMDSDFSHNPADLPKLIAARGNFDVTIGSRYIEANSLPGWSLFRRCMTYFGHFLTHYLLGIKQDASNALRIYNLKKISFETFQLVNSISYSFFFESLFILKNTGHTLGEVPIVLPARTYGHSKLNFREAFRSGMFLLKLAIEKIANPGRFQQGRNIDKQDAELVDRQNWDGYWKRKKDSGSLLYEAIASIYRKIFIKNHLERYLKRNFTPSATLLHAGCGSGQVDQDLHKDYQITAIDLSNEALTLYSKNNPTAHRIERGDILNLSLPANSFDGIYNLGVMEHFSPEEIQNILGQFKKLLKPNGKIVIFWPHKRATSVAFLKMMHFVLNKILKKNVQLHPAEPSLLKGKSAAKKILQAASFKMVDYHFNIRDLFIQAVVVAEHGDH